MRTVSALGCMLMLVSWNVAAAQDTAERPYTRTSHSVSQSEFEQFMSCYGHLDGSLDLLARIKPMVSNPTEIEDIRRAGIELMNDKFGDPYDRLIAGAVRLNLFRGERARQNGRLPFDSVEGTGLSVQYERFRLEGALSDACLSISDRVVQVVEQGRPLLNAAN